MWATRSANLHIGWSTLSKYLLGALVPVLSSLDVPGVQMFLVCVSYFAECNWRSLF